ncbi:DUF4435 domain-containing protein [candidate division KSB1 bacterium]|nr:DUF4435 domain-containing protein [candidate division KSB1 bacterium]
MRTYLNENDVINSIRLQLRHSSGLNKIWVIVEGESDQKLYSKLINNENVEIEIPYSGVTGLLTAVSTLLKETDRILGIRDADFLHLEGKSETPAHIFLTDFHDTEMMLISCDNAYHAVVAEYLLLRKASESLREKLLQSITFIGGLRWISNANKLELNFKNIGLGNFYDVENLSLKQNEFLQHVLERSPTKKKEIAMDEIVQKIENISDFYNLCNGHDFQRIFALYVNANSKKGVNAEEISKSFRIAYRFEDFQKTKLFEQLVKWSNIKAITIFKNI